ncbi:LOG family protein [Dehalococcoides mccartyi]|uniref:Uncharacterized protein n=1 Tax=Dehalococcoides mccartyi TaxID=61435 RepID=A0A142V9G7_9CHLR|nr:LOG family protein [Dehalococcoides mccartyi]AMU86412.1 hypothetical protein Dm11a5_0586 [Dehalococcoides mccartyi]AOV99240.1 hypothetical protein DCWBC2_0579 [Dehalococcoides mccartyi]MBA2085021.1 hypothetical protein [Dehalococcoides mccartyi]OBW63244.1 MAG: hypothetical protein A9183_02355 [Dehalococcoides mccartyi]PKH47974.1 hypothetical protein CVH13_00103 [Dehalococcoides mccartyi]
MTKSTRVIPPFPQMTIGVMGSAGGTMTDETKKSLRCLGACIAKRKHVLITGACPGMPHETVLGSKEEGGVVVGISPALNLEEHVEKYHSPTRGYDAIIYTGSGLMGREIENIRSCDVVIFAGGRSGTLGEFAIAYDEGKVIGVLRGSGGIADHLDKIIAMVDKETGARVYYESDPYKLLDMLEAVYRERILPKHKRLLENNDPDGVSDG